MQAQTEGGDRRPAGLRLSRRRAARLCPLRSGAACRQLPPAIAISSPCSARAISRSPSISRSRTSATRGSCRWKAAASPRRREHFFAQSEQIPSLVRLAVDDTGHVAGGILLQHLPEGEEGRERLHTRLDHPEWEHVRILGRDDQARRADRSRASARDPALAAVPRGGGGARPARRSPLSKGCRCNLEHIRGVISPLRPGGARGDGRSSTVSSASIANSARRSSRSRWTILDA